jgi:hypothetical protein
MPAAVGCQTARARHPYDDLLGPSGLLRLHGVNLCVGFKDDQRGGRGMLLGLLPVLFCLVDVRLGGAVALMMMMTSEKTVKGLTYHPRSKGGQRDIEQ